MASGIALRERIDDANRAIALLPKLKSIYELMQQAVDEIELYEAETNLNYNAAIEEVFTEPNLAELSAMADDLGTVITAWTTDHLVLLETDIENE